MVSKRKILAAAIIVSGIASMWVRYEYDKAEKRKREQLFRTLSMNTYRPASESAAVPTPDPDAVEETRDIFDSELPQESFDAIRQTIGKDFKLMKVWVSELGVDAVVSSDGETVQEFSRNKGRKNVEGPKPVQLIGGGKLSENLFDMKLVDLSLIPKLTKEAKERAALPEGKVSSVSMYYSIVYYEGEAPEWNVSILSGSPSQNNFEHKTVTFDPKGKFKKVY